MIRRLKMARKPIVAIVGRPNVGKSTFVNRLVGKRESIVDDMPGVTRDRNYFDVEWIGRQFKVIDTGGIIPGMEDEIMNSIFQQAEVATEEADAIIFMVDGKEGIHPVDYDIANILRQSDKPVFLAVNKIDSPERNDLVHEFYALGIGEKPYGVTSMHGSGGVGDMLEDMLNVLPEYNEEDDSDKIRVAIVGKPNAGKSSLINKILGKERVIVSDVAGTTRDTIDTDAIVDGQKYTFVDTAGIRKKSKVEYGVEKFSVVRAIQAVEDADITILMMDAEEGLTDQDKKIAELSNEAGKGIILAVNKWDLIEKDNSTINTFTKDIRDDAPFLNFATLMFISAKTGQRIHKLFPTILETYEQCNKKVSTSLLNRVINEAVSLNPPTSEKGKRLKVYYATQVNTGPPTFVIFVNNHKLLKSNYQRYLENKLRDAFGFFGTPIRLFTKERKDKL